MNDTHIRMDARVQHIHSQLSKPSTRNKNGGAEKLDTVAFSSQNFITATILYDIIHLYT